MERMNVYVEPSVAKWLREESSVTGVPIAVIIRRAIDKLIQQGGTNYGKANTGKTEGTSSL